MSAAEQVHLNDQMSTSVGSDTLKQSLYQNSMRNSSSFMQIFSGIMGVRITWQMQCNMQRGHCQAWGERRLIDPVLSQQILAEPEGLQSWRLQLRGRRDALLQPVQGSSSKTQINQRRTCNSVTNDYILVKAGCTTKTFLPRSDHSIGARLCPS